MAMVNVIKCVYIFVLNVKKGFNKDVLTVKKAIYTKYLALVMMFTWIK